MRRTSSTLVAVCVLASVCRAPLAAQNSPATPNLAAESKLAATVSEQRMVETVRRLVGFGPRMYGTPSNREAAAWLVSAFREAGLAVSVREDTPRAWYQPSAWEIRVAGDAAGRGDVVLKTAWPSSGSPS